MDSSEPVVFELAEQDLPLLALLRSRAKDLRLPLETVFRAALVEWTRKNAPSGHEAVPEPEPGA